MRLENTYLYLEKEGINLFQEACILIQRFVLGDMCFDFEEYFR